jgi:thiol-disulfide isomerase/thioredoxin
MSSVRVYCHALATGCALGLKRRINEKACREPPEKRAELRIRYEQQIMKSYLSVIFLFATCAAFAQTPLTTAKTIEVNETLGKAQITVVIQKPDKVSVVLSHNNGKDGSYTCDGQNAYEYHKWSNTYQKLELAPDGTYHCVLLDLAGIDLILNGGHLTQGAKDLAPVVTHEMVQGKDAVLTTVMATPSKGTDHKTYQRETKLWTDASTGLPLHRASGVLVDGKEQLFQDLTFTKFEFGSSVEIAWKAPEGSKEDAGYPVLPTGRQAPNFALKTADGKTVSLSDFKGKVVILDFWATWCGPCQRAMPHLEQVFQDVKNKDVVVLGVCVWDEKKAYDQWVQDHKSTYTFQTLFDPAGRGKESIASKYFEVQAIPTQYVIDKEGNIVKGYIPGYTKVDPLIAALKTAGVDLAAK